MYFFDLHGYYSLMNFMSMGIRMKKLFQKLTKLSFLRDESGASAAVVVCSVGAIVACSAMAMETANYSKTVSEIQSLSDATARYAASMVNSCSSPCVLDTLVDDFANKQATKGRATVTTTTTTGSWWDDGSGHGSFHADCTGLTNGYTCKAAIKTAVHAEFTTLTNLASKNFVFKHDTSDVVLRDTINQVASTTTGSVTTFGDLCPLAIDYAMFTSDGGNTYDRYWDKTKLKPSDNGYFPGGDLPDNRSYGNYANDSTGVNGYKFKSDNKKSVAWVAYLVQLKNSSTPPNWPTDPTTTNYDDPTKGPSNITTSGSKLSVGDTVWMHGYMPVRSNYSKSYSGGKPRSYNVNGVTYLDSPTNPYWWNWASTGKTCLLPVVKAIKSGDNGPYGNSGYLGTVVTFTAGTVQGVCKGTAMWNSSTSHWDAYTDDKYTTPDTKCEYGSDSSKVHPYAVLQFGKRDGAGNYSDYDAPNTKLGDAGVNAEHLGATGNKKHVNSN